MIFLEIKNFFLRKKLFFLWMGVFLFMSGGVLWLVMRQEQPEVAKEKPQEEIVEEFQKKVEKLQEVENAIERTKKELEALSVLSPEEKAERERVRAVLSAQKTTNDVFIEGVEVEVKNTTKIVVNKKEGYRIEVPVNLLIARSVTSDWIEFHDKKFMCQDPSCEPVMRIRVQTRNADELPIGEWLGKEEEKASTLIYSPREQFIIGKELVYRVLEEIPMRFEGYYYYWGKGKNIYDIRISIFDDETYRPYINTFSFL